VSLGDSGESDAALCCFAMTGSRSCGAPAQQSNRRLGPRRGLVI